VTPKLSQMIENMMQKLIRSWFFLAWRDGTWGAFGLDIGDLGRCLAPKMVPH